MGESIDALTLDEEIKNKLRANEIETIRQLEKALVNRVKLVEIGAVSRDKIYVALSKHAREHAGSATSPLWVMIVGAACGIVTLIFFMTLLVMDVLDVAEFTEASRNLVLIVLALGASLSSSFLGGAAAVGGSLPLPPRSRFWAQMHPIEFGASGGVAVLLLTLLLGSWLYVPRKTFDTTLRFTTPDGARARHVAGTVQLTCAHGEPDGSVREEQLIDVDHVVFEELPADAWGKPAKIELFSRSHSLRNGQIDSLSKLSSVVVKPIPLFETPEQEELWTLVTKGIDGDEQDPASPAVYELPTALTRCYVFSSAVAETRDATLELVNALEAIQENRLAADDRWRAIKLEALALCYSAIAQLVYLEKKSAGDLDESVIDVIESNATRSRSNVSATHFLLRREARQKFADVRQSRQIKDYLSFSEATSIAVLVLINRVGDTEDAILLLKHEFEERSEFWQKWRRGNPILEEAETRLTGSEE